ncbi:MAG: hypothetical protein H7336_10765 [Bacteriovorax sp.]|nr:hypothetical protein [Bacteriovorax sp.]
MALDFDVTAPPFDEETPTTIILSREADATNQFIATKWDTINRSVDTFFTNTESGQSENKNSVFAYTSFAKSERQKIQSAYDFQIKFDLPNTTKNLKIVIEKQTDDISDVLSDNAVSNNKTITQTGNTTFTKKDTHYSAGANLSLTKTKSFMSNIHFGIRLDLPLNPNLKLDLEKIYKTRFIDFGFLQKFIFYRQEGFQEISQFTMGKKLNQVLTADFFNSLVWTDHADMFVVRHNLVLTHNLGNEKSLSYSIGANAKFKPKFFYDSYDTSISYRQLVYNTWLYGSLAVGANFPESEGFRDDKFVQIRFDIYFKKSNL